jgi:O-antigen/teichoic acid export membrane protein
LYTLPSGWLSSLSTEFPVYFITHYFGLTTAGYFERTRQVLNAPLTQIGNSLAEVFKNSAMTLVLKNESCEPLFIRTFRLILLLSVPFFLIIFFFGPWLFEFVLGSGWAVAGTFAQILIFMFCLKLISMPLTNMYYIANKHRENLIMGILQFSILCGVMFSVYKVTADIHLVLWGYALTYGLFYFIGIYRSYIFSKSRTEEIP